MKYLLIVAGMSLALIGLIAYKNADRVFPQRIIEVQETQSIVLDRDFEDVRKAIVRGRFQEEILKINNATLVSKVWSNKNISIERPLSSDRYWSFDGTMTAKIQVGDSTSLMEMIHNVHVSTDTIKIVATLDKPLDDLGVTGLQQDLLIVPTETGKAKLDIKIYIKVQKAIPSLWAKYAEQKVSKAARESVEKFQQVISTMPSTRPKPVKRK